LLHDAALGVHVGLRQRRTIASSRRSRKSLPPQAFISAPGLHLRQRHPVEISPSLASHAEKRFTAWCLAHAADGAVFAASSMSTTHNCTGVARIAKRSVRRQNRF
jgi:hypothetical protein